jgi:hypothetical protein
MLVSSHSFTGEKQEQGLGVHHFETGSCSLCLALRHVLHDPSQDYLHTAVIELVGIHHVFHAFEYN